MGRAAENKIKDSIKIIKGKLTKKFPSRTNPEKAAPRYEVGKLIEHTYKQLYASYTWSKIIYLYYVDIQSLHVNAEGQTMHGQLWL